VKVYLHAKFEFRSLVVQNLKLLKVAYWYSFFRSFSSYTHRKNHQNEGRQLSVWIFMVHINLFILKAITRSCAYKNNLFIISCCFCINSLFLNSLRRFVYTINIKSSLHLLITISGVTSEHCPSPWLCVRAQGAMASRGQRVGDLIGSTFEPHTSRTRGRCLTTCTIWPVTINIHTRKHSIAFLHFDYFLSMSVR